MLVATLVAGQEHLTNGGFERGTTGWLFHNAGVAECEGGNHALRLAPPSGQLAFGRQRIDGPLAAGTYRVSGKAKRLTGSVSARLEITWHDNTDQVLDGTSPVNLPADG